MASSTGGTSTSSEVLGLAGAIVTESSLHASTTEVSGTSHTEASGYTTASDGEQETPFPTRPARPLSAVGEEPDTPYLYPQVVPTPPPQATEPEEEKIPTLPASSSHGEQECIPPFAPLPVNAAPRAPIQFAGLFAKSDQPPKFRFGTEAVPAAAVDPCHDSKHAGVAVSAATAHVSGSSTANADPSFADKLAQVSAPPTPCDPKFRRQPNTSDS